MSSLVRIAKRLVRRVVPPKLVYADWTGLLEREPGWKEQVAGAKGPKVLFANIGGHVESSTLESLLSVALTLRGARPEILLCDEALPACERCSVAGVLTEGDFVRNGPQPDFCPVCFEPGQAMWSQLGLPIRRYGQSLVPEDRRKAEEIARSLPVEQISQYVHEGVPVGEHAMAGALRYYARGDLSQEPHGEAVLRRYLEASLLTTLALTRLLQEGGYACVVAHHGIYVPQGLVGAVARKLGVRVVNWTIAYRKNSFIFSHDDTYHHTMMAEPVSNWEDLPWTEPMETELLDYLKSRWDGSRDWISFNRNPQEDLEGIETEIGVDFSRPCVGLLTNVIWDAQLHYPTNVFTNMMEWLVETIRYFAERPNLQLLVRIHPAENTGLIKSRQPAEEEIRKAFPTLPKNVFLIRPDSRISTYVTMTQCNAVLIYGTKTGVELTSIGVPVIVAGEAWIRNKGITSDATSRERYRELLDALPLPGRLPEEQVARARKYAYHFFFRRMIPLEFTEPAGWPYYHLSLESLEQLRLGRSAGLDVICGGILHGTEFVYPAERPEGAGFATLSPERLDAAVR